jgi:hypothetical protein
MPATFDSYGDDHFDRLDRLDELADETRQAFGWDFDEPDPRSPLSSWGELQELCDTVDRVRAVLRDVVIPDLTDEQLGSLSALAAGGQ